MLRIQQLKLPVQHTESELYSKIIKTLKIRSGDLIRYEIVRLTEPGIGFRSPGQRKCCIVR